MALLARYAIRRALLQIPDPAPNPREVAIEDERRDRILDAIESLPLDECCAVVECFWFGRNEKDASARRAFPFLRRALADLNPGNN